MRKNASRSSAAALAALAICALSCSIFNIAVSGLALGGETMSVAIGQSKMLVATISPDKASNKEVGWTSSNPGIATVTAEGVVTGVALGSATITAKAVDGGFSDTCSVTVTNPIHVASVSLPATKDVALNWPQPLAATVSPPDATFPGLSWTSSNTAVASVNNGVVTGVSTGPVVITARSNDGGFTASCNVTIVLPGSIIIYVQ